MTKINKTQNDTKEILYLVKWKQKLMKYDKIERNQNIIKCYFMNFVRFHEILLHFVTFHIFCLIL